MEEYSVMIERHQQQLDELRRRLDELAQVQAEIKTMNETLVMLATELRHTNQHLARQEEKIEVMEQQPKIRLNQIIAAVISALTGGLIASILGNILTI